MSYDEDFLTIFNEYYPFERYIVREPKSIGNLFDDALLLEVFVPNTEIKPILNPDGSICRWTRINQDEVYIKIKGPAGVMRMRYYDFNSGIREEIFNIIYNDFGDYEWECLYVDHEDQEDLKNLLLDQRKKILEKYGKCNIRDCYSTRLL